jgi:hypothetical protein
VEWKEWKEMEWNGMEHLPMEWNELNFEKNAAEGPMRVRV